MRIFIFTSGDVNGIGPEIVIKTLNRIKDLDNRYIFIVSGNVFEKAAELINPSFDFEVTKGDKLNWKKQVQIISKKRVPVNTGIPTKHSGQISFDAIKLSYSLLSKKKADAVITAPISKYALNLAGIPYPGHTEMYADWSKTKNYLMLFLSDNFNAALNTIHIPIKKIVQNITQKRLTVNLKTAVRTLKVDLGIKYPRIAVLGLNPHAGEEGVIGKEEQKYIIPAVSKINGCEGPFSPDAFFASKMYSKYNLVFGMYHDQVLIPFKMLNFNSGVNYTAGLPIIRTSPDHGTAFDIAGKGIADESSMFEAYRYAELIAKNRNTNDR